MEIKISNNTINELAFKNFTTCRFRNFFFFVNKNYIKRKEKTTTAGKAFPAPNHQKENTPSIKEGNHNQ